MNLKEANWSEELKDGMMYLKLQKKLPTSMLASYHRWVYKNHRIECVEVLREWVIQEAEFQVKALETVQGLSYSKLRVMFQNQLENTQELSLENPALILRCQVVFILTGYVEFAVDLMEHGYVEASSIST